MNLIWGDLNCLRAVWWCPSTPSSEVLQATTSGVAVSKSPRKTTTIYTKRKTKTRTLKNPRRTLEKSEYMNALECLFRTEKKRGQKRDWEFQGSTSTIKSPYVIMYEWQNFSVRDVRGKISKSIYQTSYSLLSDVPNNWS